MEATLGAVELSVRPLLSCQALPPPRQWNLFSGVRQDVLDCWLLRKATWKAPAPFPAGEPAHRNPILPKAIVGTQYRVAPGLSVRVPCIIRPADCENSSMFSVLCCRADRGTYTRRCMNAVRIACLFAARQLEREIEVLKEIRSRFLLFAVGRRCNLEAQHHTGSRLNTACSGENLQAPTPPYPQQHRAASQT